MKIRVFGLSVLLCLIFVGMVVNAQSTWSVPKASMDIQFGTTVYIETVYPKPGAAKGVNDTLSGSGFLITDSGRVYLVTAKHLVTARLLGKDQRDAHHSIFVSHSGPRVTNGFVIAGLSSVTAGKRAYVLSSDQLDIAVIALNKYPRVLAGLLKQGAKPVPADSIDMENDRYPDENYFHTTYMVFKDKKGLKERSAGLRPGKVKSFDDKKALFTIDEYINHPCAGSALFIGGTIIGMVLDETGTISNADIIKDTNSHSNTGTVVKASLIIPLLRKLQKQEVQSTAGLTTKLPVYKK